MDEAAGKNEGNVGDVAAAIQLVLSEADQIAAARKRYYEELEALNDLSKDVTEQLTALLHSKSKTLSERLENDLAARVRTHEEATRIAENDHTAAMKRLTDQATSYDEQLSRLRMEQASNEEAFQESRRQAQEEALSQAEQGVAQWLADRGRSFEEQSHQVQTFLESAQAIMEQQREHTIAVEQRSLERNALLMKQLTDTGSREKSERERLERDVLASLEATKKRLDATEARLATQTLEITSLKERLAAQNLTLQQVEKTTQVNQTEIAALREQIEKKRGIFF